MRCLWKKGKVLRLGCITIRFGGDGGVEGSGSGTGEDVFEGEGMVEHGRGPSVRAGSS